MPPKHEESDRGQKLENHPSYTFQTHLLGCGMAQGTSPQHLAPNRTIRSAHTPGADERGAAWK